MDAITFAVLLTAAGAGIAAGIITTLVELLKSVFPVLAERVSGAALAFFLSAILFVLAGIATSVTTLDQALVVFLAWLTWVSCCRPTAAVIAGSGPSIPSPRSSGRSTTPRPRPCLRTPVLDGDGPMPLATWQSAFTGP